jgi:hypothetical protein
MDKEQMDAKAAAKLDFRQSKMGHLTQHHSRRSNQLHQKRFHAKTDKY